MSLGIVDAVYKAVTLDHGDCWRVYWLMHGPLISTAPWRGQVAATADAQLMAALVRASRASLTVSFPCR